METNKTIAIVEWTWAGHHPMYFAFFIRAMLESGCTVVGFCPAPKEINAAVEDLSSEMRSRLTLKHLEWSAPSTLLPRRFRHRLAALQSVRAVVRKIRKWERGSAKRVDLVFFSCMYDTHFTRWKECEMAFPYPWSGLYQSSGKFRRLSPDATWSDLPSYVKKLFSSPKMRSLCIWDEGVAPLVERLCGRPVVSMPDLTDGTLEDPAPMTDKLKRFASGAPIIGAFGFLKRSKGVATLAKLALDPAYADLCFAFVGEVEWRGYDEEETALLSSLTDRGANIYTHFARIKDEKTFNSCINACDIVFAGYYNFADSSGILTKAAVFEKPIVVSEGYLMAERVRQYRLGEIVPEGDVAATGQAIRRLLKSKQDGTSQSSDWHGYCEQHSFARLRYAISRVLSA